MRAAVAALCLICLASSSLPHGRDQLVELSDLPGWHGVAAATPGAFRRRRSGLRGPDRATSCDSAVSGIRAEPPLTTFLRAMMIAPDAPRLVTGYDDPEVAPSRVGRPGVGTPLNRPPPTGFWLTGEVIRSRGALAGRGLDIARVSDALTAFDPQVQEPEYLRLRDGTVMRIGSAGPNGDECGSVGETLARGGIRATHRVRAGVSWRRIARNPDDGENHLRHTPSDTVFRVLNGHPASEGPLGARNRAPVWMAPGG